MHSPDSLTLLASLPHCPGSRSARPEPNQKLTVLDSSTKQTTNNIWCFQAASCWWLGASSRIAHVPRGQLVRNADAFLGLKLRGHQRCASCCQGHRAGNGTLVEERAKNATSLVTVGLGNQAVRRGHVIVIGGCWTHVGAVAGAKMR